MLSKPFAVAVTLLTLLGGLPAQAAEEQGTQKMHVVQPGETLSGLVRKLYPNSPLRETLLQDALRADNPDAFMRSKPTILLAGASMKVPSHAALIEQQYKRFSVNGDEDASGDDPQRKWVRFP